MAENQVSISSADRNPNFLSPKLQAGNGISLTDSGNFIRIDALGSNGDHKVAVDIDDNNPNYLSGKLEAGSGINLTDTGSTIKIGADVQTGDHKVSVDAADASPDYLANKITAGTNVSLTNTGSAIQVSATDTIWPDPMTTEGDIVYENSSLQPARLGIGTSGQVLTVDSGVPSWKTIPTQTGDHKVLASNSDTDPAGYLDSKISFSSPLIATGSNNLSVSIDYGQDGQILGTEGTTVKWVDRPEKVCWNINPNQTSSALTRVIDRTYFSQFFGTPGITNPTDIYVRMHEAHTSDQYYVYVFNNSNEMTHYSAFTSPTNTSVFKIPLTKLAAAFTPEYYYIAIALHANAGGQNTRFRSSTFGSSTWYYDGVFSSGDPKPANSSLTTTTTAPCFALVGR